MNKNDHLSNHPRGPSPENPLFEGGLSKEEYEQYKALLHLAYPLKKTAVRENVMAQIAADRKKQKIRQKIARYGALAACFLLITAAVLVASPLLRQVDKTSAMDNAVSNETMEGETNAPMSRSADGRQSSGASQDAMYCNSLPMFTSTDSSGVPETAMECGPETAMPAETAAEEPDLEEDEQVEITAYSLSPDDVEYRGEGEDALLEQKSVPAPLDDDDNDDDSDDSGENNALTALPPSNGSNDSNGSNGAKWVERDERQPKTSGTDELKAPETMAENEAEAETEAETKAETLSLGGVTSFLSSVPEEDFEEKVNLCRETPCNVHTAAYHTLCGSLVSYVGAEEVALWRETAQSEEACGVLSVRDFVAFFGIEQEAFQELVAHADVIYDLAEIYGE